MAGLEFGWPGPPGPGEGGTKPPGLRLPSKDSLGYTRELITTLILLLALPWLVTNLVKRPGYVIAGAGRQAVGRATK